MNKKVCLISLNLSGGGAQRAMLGQAEMFSKNGYQVEIILMKNKVHYDLNLKLYNIHFLSNTRYLSNIKLFNFILFFKKLKRKITFLEKDGKFNLILSNSYDSDQLLRFIKHKNKYHVVHGTMSLYLKKWHYIKRVLYKLIYINQKIIAVSNGVKNDFLNTLKVKPKKILTIYNPFDVRKIKQLSNNPVSFSDYVLYVGSIETVKRIDLLLKAYKKSNISQKLILLGFRNKETMTPFSLKVEAEIRGLIIKLGLTQKVECLKFVNNPYGYIKNAKLLILSSDHEGLPSVLIEALILNTMIVSTNSSSGPSEILKNDLSSFLSEPGNVNQLSDNIIKAIKSDINITNEYYEKFDSRTVYFHYKELLNG